MGSEFHHVALCCKATVECAAPTRSVDTVDDKDIGVAGLDDRGLQDLLNEAIAYKNPKDRDNKSDLFKELLAKAEADEREHSGGQRGISGLGGNNGRYRRGPSRKGDVSERNSRGGSLQNLVHALNSDLDVHVGSTNRKRGGRRNPQPQVSVSARQREGGSLPCNVNADFYTAVAAAALRSHDDVSTSSSVKKRDHPTPPDDVVTGNSYSYKLASDSSAKTAEDLSGYRPSHSGKRATNSLDDIETVASRGSGSKRRELKKLGHSSDAIFPGSTSDDICSMEDLHKEADSILLANNRIENASLNDFCAPEFASYHLRPHNNVERSSTDHSLVDDNPSQLNGPSMLGIGMNGTVRSGPDRWLKTEPRKDEGTEMTPIERTSEISKCPTSRPIEHEVDQPIPYLTTTKSSRSNGEHTVSPLKIFQTANFAAGDSVRSTLEAAPTRPRALIQQFPVPMDKNLHVWVSDSFLTKESERKSVDENGNALHQGTGSERKFKPRKNKTDNNNYVLSEKIPGHRGGTQDINELILFIESPSNCTDKSTISGKNTRNSNGPVNLKDSKQRNSSSNGKRSEAGTKVKLDKRKSGDKPKLKKSNSLEEISCTKLSDLTSSDISSAKGTEKQLKKQSTLEEVVTTRESRQKSVRSAGSNGSTSDKGSGSARSSSNRKQRESSSAHRVTPPPLNPVDNAANTLVHAGEIIGDPSEFHVVMKKQRKKKTGRSSSIGRNERNHHSMQSNNYHREAHSRRGAAMDDNEGHILYQYRSAHYRSDSPEHSQHQRRKSTSSMPSDKSADSSDLDSVHSLPISSTTPRQVVDKTSTSGGSTPQASYADIARMASAMSPPQGQACPFAPAAGSQTPTLAEGQSQGPSNKWPSVGQARPPATPLWTANVTLHTATPLPASHEEGEQCFTVAEPAMSSSAVSSSTKRDAMTNTVSPLESEPTDCSSVGNLLSDLSYPPLCESGKTPQTIPPQSVIQCVQTFISQASRTSPAISPGVTMANCVDVEDSAKRAASPAAFDSVRDNARTSALDRPAVIILDEAETEAPVNGDPELTFGFEINEMLLSGTCVLSSDEEADVRHESTAPVKVQPSITSVANINLDKIVAFVGRAWEDVIKELPEAGARGRVQFYNGQ